MAHLEVLGHSEIYRNPHPNLSSEYVAFPAIQALADGSLLCMCRHASARESDDGLVRIHRSTDGGQSWGPGGQLPEPSSVGSGVRHPGGFGIAPEGDVLAWVSYPPGPESESGQYVSRSGDGGRTWGPLQRVECQPFEHIGPGGNLVTTAEGTLFAAAEWGAEEEGNERPDWAALLASSNDSGQSWSTWQRIQGPRDERYFFDLRIAGLADGRLLAVYWTHDMERDQGLNVHTAWSADGGATWTVPQDAGFWGQVTDITCLQSGRVIAVTNHRRQPLGIRALLSEDGGQHFAEEEHVEIWGIEPAQIRSAPVLSKRRDLVENLLDSYHFFTFGTPSVTQLPDGTIAVAFYVTEEHVTYTRCCRLSEVEGE
jgi:sialidase-1